jgi:Tfp pilus assembly protein PilF
MTRAGTRTLAVVAVVLGLLAGCATARRGDREIRTDSDQSSAEKRARVRLELASAYFGRGQANTALDEVKQALAGQARPARGLQPARPDLRQPERTATGRAELPACAAD